MILCSGTYNIFDSGSGEVLLQNAPELGNNYVGFTQAAIDSVLAGAGGAFVGIAMVFFVFTTVMAYYFYSESSIMYLFDGMGKPKTESALIWIYRFVLLGSVIFGAMKEADTVWQMGDIGVGLTAWVNVIALLILCPKAISALREYEDSLKK